MTLRTVRAKVTGQILTLDDTLQDTIPAVLALFEALPDGQSIPVPGSPRSGAAVPWRRSSGSCCARARCSPLLLVFEDLHWIDTETQAVLDSLVESLPTARVLLLVNYRPEYQHGWGSKTYYTQLRLDPLPATSAEALLQALLGDGREPGAPHPAPDRPHAGQSLLSGGECADPGGDRGAGRGPWRLSSGAGARQIIQVPATVQAVLAARIDRLPPEDKRLLQTAAVIGTEVPLPLLQAIADTARRGAAPQPDAPAGGGVPLRDPPVSRARLHLQARPDPRGGLRQPAAGAAARRCTRALSRRWRRWPGTAWTNRWNGWRTMPCGARCGTRPWPMAARPGTKP